MDSWKRVDEKLLPKEENFYSSLNMEDKDKEMIKK